VGEGIFFAGLKHVAIKIIASYTEDQIITSDPSQVLALRKQRGDATTYNPPVEAPIAQPAAESLAQEVPVPQAPAPEPIAQTPQV
jgi:hypothetical protein